MASYPVPTCATVEGPGFCVVAEITEIARHCVWLDLSTVDVPPRSPVRLTFRLSDGPSLGMAGIIVRSGRQATGIAVNSSIDLAILDAWVDGEHADIGPAQRVSSAPNLGLGVSLADTVEDVALSL